MSPEQPARLPLSERRDVDVVKDYTDGGRVSEHAVIDALLHALQCNGIIKRAALRGVESKGWIVDHPDGRCTTHALLVDAIRDRIASGPAVRLLPPETWPSEGNQGRYANATAFVALIAAHPYLWLCFSAAKYLFLNIDTRSAHFTLADRDGKPLDADRVLQAMRESRQQFGAAEGAE